MLSGKEEERGKASKRPDKGKVFTYSQGSGALSGPDEKVLDMGHSGRGEYRDKPDMEHVKDNGPIPQGNYRVPRLWKAIPRTPGGENTSSGWSPPTSKHAKNSRS